MHKGPLLGYNNNVTHKGKTYHVQTEDSGTKRPHIFTHCFADGGRIIHTQKTSYGHMLEDADSEDKVRTLMKEQHKGMAQMLLSGELDGKIEGEPPRPPPPKSVRPPPKSLPPAPRS